MATPEQLGDLLGRVRLKISEPLAYDKVAASWPQSTLISVTAMPETHCVSQHDSLVISHNPSPVKMEARQSFGGKLVYNISSATMIYAPNTPVDMNLMTPGHFINLFVKKPKLDSIIGTDHRLALGSSGLLTPRSDPFVQSLLQALLADAEANHPAGLLLGEMMIAAIVNRLWRNPMVEGRGLRTLTPRQLDHIRGYIETHLDNDLTLDQMAAELGLSVRHFCREFRISTGLSPYQFVIRERVYRARQLLQNSDESLHTIAELSGFSSPGQMATTFKRVLKLAPSQIRNTRSSSVSFGA